MATSDMDYLMDDTTGKPMDADFCDVLDRRFLRVRTTQVRYDGVAVQVYDLKEKRPSDIAPAEYHQYSKAILIFVSEGSDSGPSTVKYDQWQEGMPFDQYLRKTSILSRSSSSRKFRMSDGQEYKWSQSNPAPGREWTCTTIQGSYLVAHYDLKINSEPMYSGSSGNTLTICQSFTHLTVEIITSLVIMRELTPRT